MMGIEPIRIIPFLLLAACGALCQSFPSAEPLQRSQPESPAPPEVQHQQTREWQSLPDAPAPMQPRTASEGFQSSGEEAGSPLTEGAPGAGAGVMRQAYPGRIDAGAQLSFTATHPPQFTNDEPGDFLSRHLFQQPVRQEPPRDPAASGSILGRISYAASRMFLTRDASGKDRLNTSIFVEALTVAAFHTASRPYGSQSTSAMMNDFGVSIGGDAGMHVYNELRPDIRHAVKGVTPKVLFKIQGHFSQGQNHGGSASVPER